MFLTVLAMSQKAYSKHSSAFSDFFVLKTMSPIIGLIYTNIKFSPQIHFKTEIIKMIAI